MVVRGNTIAVDGVSDIGTKRQPNQYIIPGGKPRRQFSACLTSRFNLLLPPDLAVLVPLAILAQRA